MTRRASAAPSRLRDLSVIIPVRNAEAFLDACLRSVVAADPAEIIVVDGCSTDRTLDIASGYPVRILTDHGRGVAAARVIGAEAASTRWLALIDADVVVPPGALEALLKEAEQGEYVALQAGLESESGPGYWGQALVSHHRSGRSRYWFGLVATIFLRSALLEHGLDHSFVSGEDIEIRMRLERARARAGVSRSVVVSHRFGDTFDFAMGQFLADGAGLARTARKHGWKATPLLGLPMAAGVRGAVLSLVRREPQWVPYYVTFAAVNSYAIARQLIREGRSHRR